MEKALNSIDINNSPKIYICFDRVDEAWDDVSYEASKPVIAGLVSASDSITTKYKGFLRPIIFLREDIFNELSLNDSNKLFEDCGALLHWDKTSLLKMLLYRINYYAQKKGLPTIEKVEDLFENKEMKQRAKPINHILKRTMMRPRDIIAFMKRIITGLNEIKNDPFSEEDITFELLTNNAIYNAEPGYSEWLKKEIIDELAVQKPIIKDLLNAIMNNGKTIITKNELSIELDKIDNGNNEIKGMDYMKFLYDNSIIGLKVGESSTWKYKCFYPSQGFIDVSEYKVHDGLIPVLRVKEKRNRD